MKRCLLLLATVALLVPGLGCEQRLDASQFQRRAEKAYVAANPGFRINRRTGMVTVLVRGDQLVQWNTHPLFEEYKEGGSKSSYFGELEAKLTKEAEARRRTIEQAAEDIIPIIKSKNWVDARDLGAIGPATKRKQLRPWRKELAEDVYATLAIPEELLGYRYVSMAEVDEHKQGADDLLAQASANLNRLVGSATGAVELKNDEDMVKVLDMPNIDGVGGLILHEEFRRKMIQRFGLEQIGAASPNRDVLILFDPDDFTNIKPIRARTHELYDHRNHPGFRGLLMFDKAKVWVLEPADPKKVRKRAEP